MREDEDEPDDEHLIETPDSIIEKKACALELEGSIEGLIPPELTLEISVHYEDNFLAAMNEDHAEALATIEATLTHAQAYFYDETLQTRWPVWPIWAMFARPNSDLGLLLREVKGPMGSA